MSDKKKKNKRRQIYVNMGDTVKLSKGRIGLIRFIGKTQFGLGQWIGIELYNELIRTRHNGAVLGKRYFRCPPHRGVFVRQKLIKENLPVLEIQPSINKLRAKEKKLKARRKQKNRKKSEAKKMKKEEKRKKLQEKYGNTPENITKINKKLNRKKEKKNRAKKSQSTEQIPAQMKPLKSKTAMSKQQSYDGNDDNDGSSSEEEEKEDSVLSPFEREDSVSRIEFEQDFEKNYDQFHKVLDEYTHTINDIEIGRKKLANKLVIEKKKSDALTKLKRKPRINPNLVIAAMQSAKHSKNRTTFDSARSRRGSSFVDDYNLNDTLFFDGDEETQNTNTDDETVSNTVDMCDIQEENEEKKMEDITEGNEDMIGVDPMLGTIDSHIMEEDKDEETKMFDVVSEIENETILTFYVALNAFLEWEPGNNEKGTKIIGINDSEYGNALLDGTGINTEWNISVINNIDISEMTKIDILSEIEKCETNIENGYTVMFKSNNINQTKKKSVDEHFLG